MLSKGNKAAHDLNVRQRTGLSITLINTSATSILINHKV